MCSFSESSLRTVSSLLPAAYDFTRCMRADGSAYGSRGKCRKGTQAAKEESPKQTTPKVLTPEEQKKISQVKEHILWVKNIIKEYGDEPPDSPWVAPHYEKLKNWEKELAELEGSKTSSKPKMKAAHKELNGAEKSALVNYITGGSMETGSMLNTNWKLRGLTKSAISAEENEQVRNMDSALEKLPKNTSGQTYYRGLSLDQEQARSLLSLVRDSKTWKDPGFSSYSADREEAEDFASSTGGVPLVLITRSKRLANVEKYAPGEFSDQRESILPRNTQLKVSKITQSGGVTYILLDD